MEKIKSANEFVLDDFVNTFRWGYVDTKFILNDNDCVEVTGKRYLISGYEMPYFIPFVEKVLNVPFSREKRVEAPRVVPKPKKNKEFIAAVDKKYRNRLIFDETDRLKHSAGQTTADEVMRILYEGTLKRVADAVFYCTNENDIAELIKFAAKYKVCLVPYGGGTSVSCALSLPETERRMIVVIDMSKFSRIISIDSTNMQTEVQAGITGQLLENTLNAQGYTLGHEPDSMEFSTVGGWIATNASGMKKNRYGNIEELVDNYTLVTPSGTIELKAAFSRMSSGINLHKAFIGNEGNLGFITKATLKIFKLPKHQAYGSIVFPNFGVGVQFLKELQDEGIKPASLRLVDNLQFMLGRSLRKKEGGLTHSLKSKFQNFMLTKVKKYDLKKMVASTIVFEGSIEEIEAQKKIITRIIKKYNGMFGGSQNGQRGYKLTYAIAYIRDFMADHFILGETYETTVPWDKITTVCEAVNKKAIELHKKYKFSGTCYVSPRISQTYQSGACIYFTHGLCYLGVKNPEDKFGLIEKALRKTIMDNGGSISHHHGIGKIRADFMDRVYNKDTQTILTKFKKQLDPNNIMGIQNNVFFKPQKKRSTAKL